MSMPHQPRIMATWDVSLMTDCPACERVVDLLDDPDFWENHQSLEIAEHDSARSQNMRVCCPNCAHAFHVDLEY